ncbi:unnamed protein product, partial [Prorocentrum cordatum]
SGSEGRAAAPRGPPGRLARHLGGRGAEGDDGQVALAHAPAAGSVQGGVAGPHARHADWRRVHRPGVRVPGAAADRGDVGLPEDHLCHQHSYGPEQRRADQRQFRHPHVRPPLQVPQDRGVGHVRGGEDEQHRGLQLPDGRSQGGSLQGLHARGDRGARADRLPHGRHGGGEEGPKRGLGFHRRPFPPQRLQRRRDLPRLHHRELLRGVVRALPKILAHLDGGGQLDEREGRVPRRRRAHGERRSPLAVSTVVGPISFDIDFGGPGPTRFLGLRHAAEPLGN